MFSFFEQFPKIDYQHTNVDETIKMTNILKRVKIRDNIRNNVAFFDKYHVKDGETAEIIAEKLYGDAGLHWIVLMINGIVNPYYDWPQSIPELNRLVNKKYGDGNRDAVHHWEDVNGYQVPSTEVGATAVSNFEYEDSKNETYRLIQLLKPEFTDNFITEFKELITK